MFIYKKKEKENCQLSMSYGNIGYVRVFSNDESLAVSWSPHDFSACNQSSETFLMGKSVAGSNRTPFMPYRRRSRSNSRNLSPIKNCVYSVAFTVGWILSRVKSVAYICLSRFKRSLSTRVGLVSKQYSRQAITGPTITTTTRSVTNQNVG